MKKVFNLFILSCFAISSAFAQCDPLPLANEDDCKIKLIGHRGYSHIYPENTLLALEQAFRHGVKVCEIDVRVSKDGEYVLFHDRDAIHRTTFADGIFYDKSSAELLAMSAGRYKEQLFESERIPTLVQALQLAEKYDALLYLDTKNYNLDAMKSALERSGVQAHRFAPSISSIAQAKEFRAALPNSPWVWYLGGLFPDSADFNNDAFYQQCVDLGCIAFEVSRGVVRDNSDWYSFADKVHAVGAETWAFTSSDYENILEYSTLGLDVIETDRCNSLALDLCRFENDRFSDELTRGNWRFQNSLKDVQGVGSQLRYYKYNPISLDKAPIFGTCNQFGIASLGSPDTRVMYVPKQDSLNGLFVYTNISVMDEGSRHYNSTIIMDFLVPSASMGKWIALYQTSTSNADDAELFINPSGQIGIIGDYYGNIQANTWHRLVVAHDGRDRDNMSLNLYLDGSFIGKIETFGSRWALTNSSPPGENQGFILLTDNNDETAEVYVSALQLRGYTMDSLSAIILGPASESGIPSHNADLFYPESPLFENDSTLLDYDSETYYCLLKPNVNEIDIPLSFSVSTGASSSLIPGNLATLMDGTFYVNVRSEDGTQEKEWKFCVRPSTSVGIENEIQTRLSVYPNPSNTQAWIDAWEPNNSWKLFSSVGALVKAGNQALIDTKDLESGAYYLQLMVLH
jgi:glycerophosphoryl diester phosphodiesterase